VRANAQQDCVMNKNNHSTLDDIYNEWRENLSFRKELQDNPEKALKKLGYTLNDEDMNKIKSMFKLKKSGNPGDKLDPRINK
jgi:hypothetical protein